MVFDAIAILGSLGLFLFGMKIMSEGLQRTTASRLRQSLHSMTRNRFAGVLTGFLTTSIIQSSSATTVMLVGFVNAGLVNLRQAIGVIMGANIGTTITIWLVSYLGFKFSITALALPAVGIGMALLLFKGLGKEEWGTTLIGFGILFLGLDFLKDSVPDLRSNPELFDFVTNWQANPIVKFFAFFVFGSLLTVVVQSSSAASAITVALAAKGLIDYPSACAIILGENVGTTITANIAAIGANTNARRTGLAHLIFNLIGVCWMMLIFIPFIGLVDAIMPGDSGDSKSLPEHLALFHTLFNVTNTALLIGFVPQLVKFVSWAIKSKDHEIKNAAMVQSSQALPSTGELNVAGAQNEVLRMAQLSRDMFTGFQEVYKNPDKDFSQRIKELKEMEDISDMMAENITNHLMMCSSDNLSDESASRVTTLIRGVAELEAMCDCTYRLIKLTAKRHRKNRTLSPEIEGQLEEFSGWVLQMIDFTTNNFGKDITPRMMTRGVELENEINRSRKRLRRFAMERMQQSEEIAAEMLHVDMLNHMERIGNHCLNILHIVANDSKEL
ncbi:MAG: Na/Pi cotransporter family protein [Verrucomicrobiota bacterium]